MTPPARHRLEPERVQDPTRCRAPVSSCSNTRQGTPRAPSGRRVSSVSPCQYDDAAPGLVPAPRRRVACSTRADRRVSATEPISRVQSHTERGEDKVARSRACCARSLRCQLFERWRQACRSGQISDRDTWSMHVAGTALLGVTQCRSAGTQPATRADHRVERTDLRVRPARHFGRSPVPSGKRGCRVAAPDEPDRDVVACAECPVVSGEHAEHCPELREQRFAAGHCCAGLWGGEQWGARSRPNDRLDLRRPSPRYAPNSTGRDEPGGCWMTLEWMARFLKA